MTNVKFPSIDDYRDIETLNMYREAVNEGGSDHDQVMRAIYAKGRDNARTPMQWNRERHGGFTTGEPWLAVNPNFTEINVEQALQDEDSILHFYRRLIRLRKQHKIIIEGSYELILPDDEQIFAYLRRYGDEVLLVVSNFAEEEPEFKLPDEVTYVRSTLLIGNYPDADGDSSAFVLRPYETRVYLLQR